MFDKEKFCKKLIDLKHSRNISSKDLAKIISITPASLSHIENKKSKPNIETLMKLALYFNVSLDYLTGMNDLYNQSNEEISVTNSNFNEKRIEIEIDNMQIEVKFKKNLT